MGNKPDGDQKDAEAGKAPDLPPGALNSPQQPPQRQNRQREAGQQRGAAEHIMGMLIAAWAGLRMAGRVLAWLVALIDRHGALMTALATVAIAVLTGMYVKYSKAQWEAVRDQSVNMRRQLIAVIGILDLNGPFEIQSTHAERFELHVRNHGGGAARYARWIGHLLVIPIAEPCRPVYKKPFGTELYRAGESIGPGQSHPFALGPWFNAAGTRLVKSGKGSIVLTGKIKYEDLFGERHAEPFCFRFAKAPDGIAGYFRCVNSCPKRGY